MTTHTPDKPERPRTLGRTVHEKYPAAVVGEASELTLVEGGERGGAPGPTESEHTTNSPASSGERDAYRDDLTHVDEHGDVRMVDVGDKQVTKRIAIAEGTILMHPETQAMVLEDRAKKGDVLACARVAGIMASKRTSDLIPMCHPLNITKAKVEIEPISSSAVAAPGWAPAREDHRVGTRRGTHPYRRGRCRGKGSRDHRRRTPFPASRRAAHRHAGTRRRLCGIPERRQDHTGGEGHFPPRTARRPRWLHQAPRAQGFRHRSARQGFLAPCAGG